MAISIENAAFWIAVLLALFAVGDIAAAVTKAKLSSVFVALMLALIGFLTGVLPPNFIDRAGLTALATYAAAFLIFHMGTLIEIRQFIEQWRTVVAAVISMIAVAVVLGGVGYVLVGKPETLVSIPIINGGIIATQIMVNGAAAKGYALAAALGTLVYAVQKFVGTPIASYFGVREARKIVKLYREGQIKIQKSESAERKYPGYHVIDCKRYQRYLTDFVLLAITAFFAWLSMFLDSLTGLNYSIWALILGVAVSYVGLVPNKILDLAKGSGWFMVIVFASIIPSLAKIKAGDLLILAYQLVVVFAASLLGVFVFMYLLPAWRLVGSRNLAVGIGVAQMLGFPATYLVANEVANAVGETKEEREAILQALMPAYVIAGFATVTTISIIIAGLFVGLL
ncbi:MAG: hypothetical protein QW705_04135 [Zestosphaera sp.]